MALTKWFSFGFFLLAPAFANAVIIDGYFSGWVMGGDINDNGISKDLTGEELSGQFWYDTELMPALDPDQSYAAIYRSNTNKWLGLTYYINGRTIDVSNSIGETYDRDYTYETMGISSLYNSFQIQDAVRAGDYVGDFVEFNSRVGFYGGPVVIHNNDLLQNFSWLDSGAAAGRGELFGYERRAGDEYAIGIEIYITRLDVSVRNGVPVPEPSGIMLLLSCFFMLSMKKRLQNNFH